MAQADNSIDFNILKPEPIPLGKPRSHAPSDHHGNGGARDTRRSTEILKRLPVFETSMRLVKAWPANSVVARFKKINNRPRSRGQQAVAIREIPTATGPRSQGRGAKSTPNPSERRRKIDDKHPWESIDVRDDILSARPQRGRTTFKQRKDSNGSFQDPTR